MKARFIIDPLHWRIGVQWVNRRRCLYLTLPVFSWVLQFEPVRYPRVSPEAVVYSANLPEWVQNEINADPIAAGKGS